MYFGDSDNEFEIDPEDYYGHDYFDLMFDDVCGLYDHFDHSDYEDEDEDDDDDDNDFYTKSYLPEDEVNLMKRCQAICAGLHRDREEGLFCDAKIVVEEKEFAVHKTVLKSSSSYFTAMFTGAFTEKNESKVHIQGVTSEMFSILLDYMYGAKVSITFENVKEIYQAADMLCIDALITECKNFIKYNWVSAKNVQSVFEIAKEIGLDDVTKVIIDQGRTRLVNFLGEKDYRELTDTFLLTILEGRNTLKHLENETLLASYLIKWVFFKPEERLPDVAVKVFSAIRFEYISNEEFADLSKLVHSFESVPQDDLNRFLLNLEDLYKTSHQKLFDLCVTMVLTDGMENEFGGNVRLHQFCFQNWKWETVSCQLLKMPESLVISKDDVYMFTSEGCTKMNLQTKHKLELPKFQEKRTMSVFTVFNNHVYAAGGTKEGTNKPLGDIMKLSNDQWIRCIIWRKPKCEASAITHGQYIYYVGGKDITKKFSPHAQCFSYNTLNRYFHRICNLNIPVLRPKLAIYDDVLYVFSERHRLVEMSSVEGIDLKRHELLPQSAFKGLELNYAILGVTAVSTGLLIAYSVGIKILLGLYRPKEEPCMVFLGLISKPSQEGLYRPIAQNQLLFSDQS